MFRKLLETKLEGKLNQARVVDRLVMTPKVLADVGILAGQPNCGWLKMLKNSARKSTFVPSRKDRGMRLMIEKSVFTKSGP